MSKTSDEVDEVIFDQPEEKAGTMEPDGSVPNRHQEEEWLGDTEPYHGARPRATQFDRPVDEGLGATSGGLEENVQVRDILVPSLQPEQQIEEELLKKLLAVLTPKVPPPVRVPELSPMDKLVQLLLSETAKREPAPPTPAEPPGLETLHEVFLMRENGA